MKISDLQFLAEDLGSLAVIDGDLRAEFKQLMSKYDGLGKDSPVSYEIFKTGSAAYSDLFAEDTDVKAVIMRYNGKQILFSSAIKFYYNKEMYENIDQDLSRKTKVKYDLFEIGANRKVDAKKIGKWTTPDRSLEHSWMKRVITNIFKGCKEAGGMIDFIVIKLDAKRKEITAHRRELGAPGVHTRTAIKRDPSTNKDRQTQAFAAGWGSKVNKELQIRLEKFKAENVIKDKSIQTPTELLQLVKKSGYLNKFSMGGFIYKMYNNKNTVEFDGLKDKDGQPIPVMQIRYDADSTSRDDSPVLAALRTKYSNAAEEILKLHMVDSEEYKKAATAHNLAVDAEEAKFPPISLNIEFHVQDGAIVPTKIKASVDKAHLYLKKLAISE